MSREHKVADQYAKISSGENFFGHQMKWPMGERFGGLGMVPQMLLEKSSANQTMDQAEADTVKNLADPSLTRIDKSDQEGKTLEVGQAQTAIKPTAVFHAPLEDFSNYRKRDAIIIRSCLTLFFDRRKSMCVPRTRPNGASINNIHRR